MNKVLYIIVLLLFLPLKDHLAAQGDVYERLSSGFRNPPDKARPKVYWWCLNGNIDTIRAKEELQIGRAHV